MRKLAALTAAAALLVGGASSAAARPVPPGHHRPPVLACPAPQICLSPIERPGRPVIYHPIHAYTRARAYAAVNW